MKDKVEKILDKMIVGATNKRFKNVGEILLLIQSTYKIKQRSIYAPKYLKYQQHN